MLNTYNKSKLFYAAFWNVAIELKARNAPQICILPENMNAGIDADPVKANAGTTLTQVLGASSGEGKQNRDESQRRTKFPSPRQHHA